MNKYPEYIYRNVRQSLDLDSNDTTLDEEINDMSPNEVIDRYWQWEGIIGYTNRIIDTVFDVYEIDKEMM